MTNIMHCMIGKEFGIPEWQVQIGSPFNKKANFCWQLADTSPPFPVKNFDCKEVEAFRDYLTEILDEYKRIVNEMEQMNV